MSDDPYLLHYAPDNASLVIRLALEHIGAPYRTHLVDRSREAQRSAAHLALHPNGLNPVLETPQGPIFETAAILLWLSERHDGLGPRADAPGRGDFLKWLFFLSNTLHPGLRMLFYTEKYIGPNKAHQQALVNVTQQSVLKHLSLLEMRWSQDAVPCAFDLYLCPMLRWIALYPAHRDKSWFDLTRYPALHAAAKEMETRPATLAAQAAEGLGPTPFTAPRAPTPPEGSAT